MLTWALSTFLWGVGAGIVQSPSPYHATYHPAPPHSHIAGDYIVGLRPSVSVDAHLESLLGPFPDLNLNRDGSVYPPVEANTVRHTFTVGKTADSPAFEGFTGTFSDDVIQTLMAHGEVWFIEEDQWVTTMNHQFGAPWDLSRMSHHRLPTGKQYADYSYDDHAGLGTSVYVIDTGIYCEHSDFEGRAKFGANFVKTDPDQDLNGHGTHCAGTIAGKTFGVAKKANLIAVKVLDGNGSGSMSDVVKGVEWTIQDHMRRKKHAKDGKPVLSVANMSLGGGQSRTLNLAVNHAVEAGIHFAVAAGNDNSNACLYSPASADGPMTVGASTKRDSMAYFSNHGKCVDIFAPGHHILSTWIGDPSATNVLSGTSMASPHLAGLQALYVSVHCNNATAEALSAGQCSTRAVKKQLISKATAGVLRNLPDGKRKNPLPDWPFPFPMPGQPDEPDTPDEGETPNLLAYVVDLDRADSGDSGDTAEWTSKNGGYFVRMAETMENNPFRVLAKWVLG